MKPVLLVRNDAYETFGVAPAALVRAGCDLRTANMTDPSAALRRSTRSRRGDVRGDRQRRRDGPVPLPKDASASTRARRVERGVPYLGICLGAQILARALGRTVVRAPVREVGFEPLHPTADATDDPLLARLRRRRHGVPVARGHVRAARGRRRCSRPGTGSPVQATGSASAPGGSSSTRRSTRSSSAAWLEHRRRRARPEDDWGKSADEIRAEAARHMRGARGARARAVPPLRRARSRGSGEPPSRDRRRRLPPAPGRVTRWRSGGYGVPEPYVDAVRRAGGASAVAPAGRRPAIPPSCSRRFDGLLLVGGGDVEPARYGAEPHEALYGRRARPRRLEIALLRAADRRGMPALCICRGMQVMNVAFGGTLLQHLPAIEGASSRTATPNVADALDARRRRRSRKSVGRGRRRTDARLLLAPPPGHRPARARGSSRPRGAPTASSRPSSARRRLDGRRAVAPGGHGRRATPPSRRLFDAFVRRARARRPLRPPVPQRGEVGDAGYHRAKEASDGELRVVRAEGDPRRARAADRPRAPRPRERVDRLLPPIPRAAGRVLAAAPGRS